jgi:ABC-type multidrug transport system ATPase subunit
MTPRLVVESLACVRGERRVFAGVDIALAAGEALVLTGPNGAGKSSLLRTLAGLIPAAAGRILWDGADVAKDPDTFRAELHAVPHIYTNYVVPPYYDSLLAKLIAYGGSREEALARMKSALREMIVGGIRTNLPLHQRIMDDPGFRQGGVSIHYLQEHLVGK